MNSTFSTSVFVRYSYEPRGTSEAGNRSRDVRNAVKSDRSIRVKGETVNAIDQMVKAVANNAYPPNFFGDVIAIPIPRSSPLVKGALWVPQRIANELLRHKLVSSVELALRRETSVRSSHTSFGNRPTVDEHYESITFSPSLSFGSTRLVHTASYALTVSQRLIAP